jgi:putative membrane protein
MLLTEALLAFAHLSAILGWVVFVSGQVTLCRADWLNAAVVSRLARLDAAAWLAAAAVLLTGLARAHWGIKDALWYWHNPLLWTKLALFALAALLLAGASRRYRRWRARLAAGGALPLAADVRGARWRAMVAAHVVAVIPLAAVLMARGFR